MARDLLRAFLKLDHIHCHDEGDGIGSAEPYLWTVFFKIDGDTVVLTDALMLSGTATVVPKPGSHGNLPNGDVDPGENVTIPEILGEWSPILTPIPVPASLQPIAGDDLPAIVGVVTVLMEEDNVTDDGAEAGHTALNDAVSSTLADIIATRSFTNQEITEEEIDAYLDAIEDAIKDAVRNQQNIFEDIWSFLNADDQIGSKVFFFDQDDLAGGETIEFSVRFDNHGDWELFGRINAAVICPAEAVSSTSSEIGALFERVGPDMRAFRGREFGGTQLPRWWALAERNAPVLSDALRRNEKLAASIQSIAGDIPSMLKDRDAPITKEQLAHAEQILVAVRDAGSRRARIDASRALDMLPLIQGRRVADALELLGSLPPGRQPRPTKDISYLLNDKIPATSSLRHPVKAAATESPKRPRPNRSI